MTRPPVREAVKTRPEAHRQTPGAHESAKKLVPCSKNTNSTAKPLLQKQASRRLSRQRRRMCLVSIQGTGWLKELTRTTDNERDARYAGTLGPRGDSHAKRRRTFQITTCGTFLYQSNTRAFKRCGTTELLHADGLRKRRRRGGAPRRVINEGSLVLGGFSQHRGRKAVSPSSNPWTRLPIHNCRHAST